MYKYRSWDMMKTGFLTSFFHQCFYQAWGTLIDLPLKDVEELCLSVSLPLPVSVPLHSKNTVSRHGGFTLSTNSFPRWMIWSSCTVDLLGRRCARASSWESLVIGWADARYIYVDDKVLGQSERNSRTDGQRESEKCMTDGGREMEENGRVLVFVGCRTNDKLDACATVPKSQPFLTLS